MDETGTTSGSTPQTSACPGCGAVLAVVPELTATRPGASASCAGLFAVTVRGLREDADRDTRSAAQLQLATDTYDAQHLPDGAPAAAVVRLCLWVERGLDPQRAPQLADRITELAPADVDRPGSWTTALADVAADLDVVDLPALIASWSGSVWADWQPASGPVQAAADALGLPVPQSGTDAPVT